MRDELDDLLGIDTEDPTQRLALELVRSDRQLLAGLVAHRRARGLSQSEVGRRMGVTQPAVAAFERADADPKLSTIRRYALAVGADVRHLVRDHAATPPLVASGPTGSRSQTAHTTVTSPSVLLKVTR
ncbi:helix-turn-helix domain-containing protein [Actinokineospora enzanensis]|uniref:helix-turn-helix domain-containing protein n=1 Tax=Actinokineospora enzanensis TaxID=155975 RepID=UPI0003A06B26|nr:helix-turn-helix transcriptional regulator [Actinokineospora enzanensis]